MTLRGSAPPIRELGTPAKGFLWAPRVFSYTVCIRSMSHCSPTNARE
jgi:hypothetical protein